MREYPFIKVDSKAIARGFVKNIMNEEERTILRFGMLPAEKIKMLENTITDKLKSELRTEPAGNDLVNVYFTPNNNGQYDGEVVIDSKLHVCRNVNFKRMISDVVHSITVEMYGEVEMVV